jgi:hypothetical protein
MAALPADRGRSRWAAAAVAVFVVLTVFPDVVFLGASVRNSRVLRIFDPDPEVVNLIPESEGRRIWEGYRDLGAASWQLEPAQRFLRRCLEEGQSPYWNPYNALGTHGPERLASASFSALTVATALLGAGTGALHAVLLLTFVAALYCLYRALTVHLGRSMPAAVLACFAFLLVGFHTSMIGAQMVHPYLLGPIVLLALLRLADSPTPGRFVVAVLAHSLILAETFLPTTLLALITVHAIALAHGARRWRRHHRELGRQLAAQGAASALGLLLLAPLWLPIAGSVPLAEWGDYDARAFETARPRAALSLVTPKHFWESYGAFPRSRGFDDDALYLGSIDTSRVYHLGLLALLIAVQAFAGRKSRHDPVVWTAGALMAVSVGRLFGLFPFQLIEHLPVFGLMSVQYWGLLLSFPFCLLLAHGFDALSPKTVWRWPTFAVVGFVGACFFFLLGRLGAPTGPALVHLGILGALLAIGLGAFALLRRRRRWRTALVLALLALSVGEWIFYMNRLRPVRKEHDFDKIGFVTFLRDHLREGERVFNVGGRGLYPNWGSALAIPQIDSLDGVNLAWYGRFFDRRFGTDDHFLAIRHTRRHETPAEIAAGFDFEALDLLGVRYLVVTGVMEGYRRFFRRHGFEPVFRERGLLVIFENPDPLPRTFAVDTLLHAPGIPSDWRLPSHSLALTTDRRLLAEASALGVSDREPPPEAARRPAPGRVEIVERRHTRVVIEADLERPAVVVLADSWHPGWRATVDGEPVSVGRVDEVLRGVAVPAGKHRIVFRYTPRFLLAGVFVSLLTTALLAAGAAFAARRARAQSR